MRTRYAGQTCLPEWGEVGQERLGRAHVLVVGAGGLGTALLPVLAGAGLGHIHIMDDDRVEEANLYRQTLYRMEDIGRSKAEMAVRHLQHLNPHVRLVAHVAGAEAASVETLLHGLCGQGGDNDSLVVLDAADNFATTYMLSDLCKALHIPLISASAIQWGGYAGIFCGTAPSYRAVFPDMGQATQDCQTAGVSGPVVGVLGMVQAQLCLSLLLGMEPSPAGILYRWDSLRLRMSSFSFQKAREPMEIWPFLALSQLCENDIVIDVRIPGEQPAIAHASLQSVPLDQFSHLGRDSFPKNSRLVLCCQSGIRAARAAKMLQDWGYRNMALVAMRHQGAQ